LSVTTPGDKSPGWKLKPAEAGYLDNSRLQPASAFSPEIYFGATDSRELHPLLTGEFFDIMLIT